MIERQRHIDLGFFGLLLGVVVVCLIIAGCSDDDDNLDRNGIIRLETTSMISDMGETSFPTRALSGYSTFSPSEFTTTSENQIGVFMSSSSATLNAVSGVLNYASGGKWQTYFSTGSGIAVNTQYYIYGFMPADVCTSASMSFTDYTKGGEITLADVNPVSNSDMCAIVGVADESEDLAEGMYSYTPTKSGNDKNTLSLALNHVCSRVKVNMCIGEAYSALRQVKIKSMSLSSSVNKGTLTVTVPNSDGQILSAVFTPSADASKTCSSIDLALMYSKQLPITKVQLADFYCPPGVKDFILTTTYDVYDNTGTTVVAASRTATNNITMTKVFDLGMSYDLNITVTPTYLYHIKTGDMDDPDFVY